jgi:hypothetical protein
VFETSSSGQQQCGLIDLLLFCCHEVPQVPQRRADLCKVDALQHGSLPAGATAVHKLQGAIIKYSMFFGGFTVSNNVHVTCHSLSCLQDQDGKELGVAGSVQQLAQRSLSSQPVNSFDWSPDKQGLFVCSALDQCLRVGFVTKLNKL